MSTTTTTISSGHEGTIRDQVKNYFVRVKSGEMGALPSVISLIFLTALFASLNPYFLTKLNFANLLVQSATLMMLSMPPMNRLNVLFLAPIGMKKYSKYRYVILAVA